MNQSPDASLPSGVVTFLFTDVEGSTRLWASDDVAMAASLRLHDEILRGVIEARDGFVFTTAGDSFAAAFHHASSAVDAARTIQEQLALAQWPGPPLRVRIGIHLGEVEERGGDYFGPVVNTCARVEAAGHGGQVLVTEAVQSVATLDGAIDLGAQHLRDLPEPLHLFQVGPGEFGPLRGVQHHRDSLPDRRTRLIGRDVELSELAGLIESNRLTTIVGPGGMGKTSVAIEVAGAMSNRYPGGANFADLATVSADDDLIGAVCRGVQLTVSASPYDELVAFLSMNETLLIVDNCEHVIDAAAELIDRILADVPTLRVLATSREHLDLDGEQIFRLGPLALSADASAVRLFIERAVSSDPEFDPGHDEREQILNICTRLDGMPLAIELAAARVRTLSLSEIETRLDDRFTLLAGGRRGRLRRQQTLRATLEWSIALLETGEADLLASLAVFVAGFDITGAAAVGTVSTQAAADAVASLEAKSLVQRTGVVRGMARYRLLETVREWGLEALERMEELRSTRDAHARHFYDQLSALDTYEVLSHQTRWEWDPDIQDVTAAIEHLREDDPVAAALIATPVTEPLVHSGNGTLAIEVLTAGLRLTPQGPAIRMWESLRITEMLLLIAEDILADCPADDGTPEWRYLIGGTDADFSGIQGWAQTWVAPNEVAAGVAALSPPRDDRSSLMVRAFGLANACTALTFLGAFPEAIEAWTESRRLIAQAGGRTPPTPDIDSAVVAATVASVDLRWSVIESELEQLRSTKSFPALLLALARSAPTDRPTNLALAAREYCHGRFPEEESFVLALLAFFAIEDGDLERGRRLNDTVATRSPASVALRRHNLIRIEGLSLQLMADPHHHLAVLASATGAAPPGLNRRKMLDEIAHRLD